MMTDALRIVADPAWHAHRINAAMSEIYFVRIDREQHRAVTFLEDKYLSPDLERATLPFAAVEAAVASFDHAAPRFIFHSSMAGLSGSMAGASRPPRERQYSARVASEYERDACGSSGGRWRAPFQYSA